MATKLQKLLFIDTNIWLDFYRARNETGLALLSHVSARTRRQVRMRCAVIAITKAFELLVLGATGSIGTQVRRRLFDSERAT